MRYPKLRVSAFGLPPGNKNDVIAREAAAAAAAAQNLDISYRQEYFSFPVRGSNQYVCGFTGRCWNSQQEDEPACRSCWRKLSFPAEHVLSWKPSVMARQWRVQAQVGRGSGGNDGNIQLAASPASRNSAGANRRHSNTE